jgi:hypothetical protein
MEEFMAGAVVMRTSSGLMQRNPTENRIRALVSALSKGQYVMLEQFGSSESNYIQVWLRPEGIFQLEYRAGHPSEHFQARTESRDRVASALFGWSMGGDSWRDAFEWNSIGDWFDHQLRPISIFGMYQVGVREGLCGRGNQLVESGQFTGFNYGSCRS